MKWQGLFFGLVLAWVLAIHPANAQVATVNADCVNAMMHLQTGAPLVEDQKGHLCVNAVGGTGTSANQIQGNVAGAATDSGNPVKIGSVFNTTQPTYTTGQRTDSQTDARGNLFVTLMAQGSASPLVTQQSSTDTLTTSGSAVLTVNSFGRLFNGSTASRQYQITALDGTGLGVAATEAAGSSFVNITTATTTTVKSGTGIFHSLCINTPLASETVTIYNSLTATGTKIGTVTIPATITGENPSCQTFNVFFSLGLTFVTSSTADLTVVYR